MKARRTVDLFARSWSDVPGVPQQIQQGDFDVTTDSHGQRWFAFCCPGPCKTVAMLAIRPVVKASGHSWDLSGTDDAPTLHPSINHVSCWHGWLRDGVFTPA
jgi:hypothetical protein